METATIREVQHNLASFVRKVEHGEEIEIRRRNRVVARLVPAGDVAESARDLDWGELRKWRKKVWGGRRRRGKTVSETVYDSRGER